MYRWCQVAKHLHVSLDDWINADELKREAIWHAFEWLTECEKEAAER